MACPKQYPAPLALTYGQLLRMPVQVIIETNWIEVPYPCGSGRYLIMAKQEKTA
jgi:hypothetical protein